MTNWPNQDPASMNAFYGNPDTGLGQADPRWVAQNIIPIQPPFPMIWSWDINSSVKALRVHRKCADAMSEALRAVGDTFSPTDLVRFQLNRTGGAFCFREMRSAHRLSIHSWGAAIDIAPEINPMGKPPTMPQMAVDIFKKFGATWGGSWHNPDGMHFQFANV